MSAAEQLKGLALQGGWTVIDKLKEQPSSGGYHSVPYIVQNAAGKSFFLKAFDFSTAFQPGGDVVSILQRMTSAYEHERDILEHCRTRRLSGVVLAVTHGYVHVPGTSVMEGTVYYLIFELADGDIRRQVDVSARLDCAWCLKILDDVTLGLWQVHREGIAHQDAKPSNILVYNNDNCRIADFGRSSRRGRQVWTDDLPVAGDRTYAPPELLYSLCHPDFVIRRLGCDLYLLGNLVSFLFSGINVTSGIFTRLDPQFHPDQWGGTYEQVLPHVQRAFDDLVIDLQPNIDAVVRDEMIQIIQQLCCPDLAKRGHPKGIGTHTQYSLERYKSQFDLLIKKTRVALRAGKTA